MATTVRLDDSSQRQIREDSQFGTSPSTNAYAASPIVAYRLFDWNVVASGLHNQRVAIAHRAHSLINANVDRHFRVTFGFDQRDFDSRQSAPVE